MQKILQNVESLIVSDGSSVEEASNKVELIDSHPGDELDEPEAKGVGEEGLSQ